MEGMNNQETPQTKTRPGVDIEAVIEAVIAAFNQAEVGFEGRLWNLEQRLRVLEGARDREFECELNRRLRVEDGAKGLCAQAEESPLSQLRRRVRAL